MKSIRLFHIDPIRRDVALILLAGLLASMIIVSTGYMVLTQIFS